MKFYRVILKDDDCDVIMAIFLSKLEAFDYYYNKIKSMPNCAWLVDDIDGNILVRNAFIGEDRVK